MTLFANKFTLKAVHFENNEYTDNKLPFRDEKFQNYNGKKTIEKEVNCYAFVLFLDDSMIKLFTFITMLRSMRLEKDSGTKLVWSVIFLALTDQTS
jgi:hypothetical protein